MSKKLLNAQKKLMQMMNGIELLASLLIIVGIGYSLLSVPMQIQAIQTDGLGTFLQYLFDVLIAIELIKLLCSHELTSMVEVLLFAVSKHVIIGNLSSTDNLIAVISIAVLFAIRKFLFMHKKIMKPIMLQKQKPLKTICFITDNISKAVIHYE